MWYQDSSKVVCWVSNRTLNKILQMVLQPLRPQYSVSVTILCRAQHW